MAQKTLNLRIINVSQPTFAKTANGGYNKIEVTFKDVADGKVGGKPLVDFNNASSPNNKAIYSFAQGLKEGDEITVTIEKPEGGKYWNWVGAERSSGAAKPAEVAPRGDQSTGGVSVADSGQSAGTPAPKAGRGRVAGSNYETPSERAARQVYIVRQSSISSAIALLQSQGGVPFDTGNVIEKARDFEAYVFEKGPAGKFDDMEDDIPF